MQRLSDYQQFPAHFPTDTTHIVLNVLDTIKGPGPAHTVTVSTDWLWVIVPLAVIGADVLLSKLVTPVYRFVKSWLRMGIGRWMAFWAGRQNPEDWKLW